MHSTSATSPTPSSAFRFMCWLCNRCLLNCHAAHKTPEIQAMRQLLQHLTGSQQMCVIPCSLVYWRSEGDTIHLRSPVGHLCRMPGCNCPGLAITLPTSQSQLCSKGGPTWRSAKPFTTKLSLGVYTAARWGAYQVPKDISRVPKNISWVPKDISWA